MSKSDDIKVLKHEVRWGIEDGLGERRKAEVLVVCVRETRLEFKIFFKSMELKQYIACKMFRVKYESMIEVNLRKYGKWWDVTEFQKYRNLKKTKSLKRHTK